MFSSCRTRIAALAVASSTFFATPPTPAPPRTTVDWPAFLGRHDMVWNRLPSGWGEAAFVGNGRLGATIDRADGVLGWTINRTDVVHDASRYPIGRVLLKTAGTVTGGTMRLSLWNAEVTGTVVTARGEIRWRSFVARDPEVIVIALDGRGGESAPDLDWSPALARPPRKVHNNVPFDSIDIHPPAVVARDSNGITSVQTFVGGDAHAEAIRRVASTGRERIFFVSIGYAPTEAPAVAEAHAANRAALAQGLSRLATNHRRWWHAYYPESFVSFPDERLEGYYWIQIYKLGAAMRPDGPILDLNGPWFNDTPWPAIWFNLNIQLTYSPLFRANRLELAESLFRNLDRGTQALIDNVPARLRPGAAAIGRSAGPDLHRPVDLATANSDAAHEMGDLPWTMFYYWEHYRYQMDDTLLRRRLYPLLRLAIGNYLPYLEKDSGGAYHLPPTESPELAVVADANYDLALLRWGLRSLIASAERLRVDEPLLPRWRDVLAHLTPFPADSTGLWVGRDRPWQQSHRHYSHLLAIYPLGLITPDSPANRELIEASLRAWEREPSLFRGYSFTGGGSMHAMLGQGDTVLARLTAYLDFPKYMQPNTMYAEAGPVIETPLSAATTIQEMFLQDWGGAIRVFPGMPSAWRDASFADLRADGAFLVSGVRRDARTTWVRVSSLAGQPLRVVVADWDEAVVVTHEGPAPRVKRAGTGQFEVTLAKGATATLASHAGAVLSDVAPVALPNARRSWPSFPDASADGPRRPSVRSTRSLGKS
jgi:alpha-L-fucosidase 2